MKRIYPLLLGCALLLNLAANAAEESSADKQQKLIAVLKSDAPSGEKAAACKLLAVYGKKEAVPALAPLLENKDLISWARIALEAIPGPEADEALRAALPKIQGNMLIGVINSIGVRRDAKAVDVLAEKLRDSDASIVAASAAALGKIGGTQVATVLGQRLGNASGEILPAIAEGCILCAERFLNEGKFSEAAPLYDAVRSKAGMPTQKKLEATRGAILARQSQGLPLLLEQLRSEKKAEFGMALRTARELKGVDVTKAIGQEMDRTQQDRKVMLLLALSDRHDDAVLPKLLEVAEKGSKDTRVAAVTLLDRFGEVKAVPVLLAAAADADADLATPAKATLTRMEGKAVDDALLSRLPQSSGKTRQVIIELAALRRIHDAMPQVIASVQEKDPAVRRAALGTLTALGTERHAGELVSTLGKTKDADDRENIERALMAISGRTRAKSLDHVLPLTKNEDPELRMIGLRTLSTIGGPKALSAVASALDDSDEAVQDEAVGTLATWPNNWPEDSTVAEPLLALVNSGRKPAYKIQGTRGYLLHLQENKKLSNADKLKAIDRLLPSLKLAQEKRLAISTLGAIPTGRSLELLTGFTEDPAIAEEACLAMVTVATAKNLDGASKEARQKALQTALDKSKNETTRAKASEALKSLQ